MTFKTVQFDADGEMAASTEMLALADACNLAIVSRSRMTIDAFNQTMLFTAYPLIHGFIAFMQQVLHVIRTHVCSGFYAFLTFWCGHDITVCIPIRPRVLTARKAHCRPQQECGDR